MMGYAKFVGRVGGLAVALGVGVLLSHNPAVAWADETAAGSSSSSSASSSETDATTPTSAGQESEPDPEGASTSSTSSTSSTAASSSASSDGTSASSSVVSHPGTPAVVVSSSGGAISAKKDASAGSGENAPHSSASGNAADSVAADTKSNSQTSPPAQVSGAAVTDAVVDARPEPRTATTAVAPQALSAPVPIDQEEASQQWVSKTIADFMSGAQNWISVLPVGPGVKEWLTGVLYFVRRTFLNQDPTVAPVQISGQISGPITGNVGAVDPEGDRIVYRLSKTPTRGSVQIGPEGAYTYTPGAGFDGVDTFTVTADDPGFHINLLNPFEKPGTDAKTLINQGAIKFEFNYENGSQYWSTEARDAMQSAADALAAYVMVKSPVTITYSVKGENSAASSTLASAFSDLITSDAGFYNTVVQNKLLTGADSNGEEADGEIEWNFSSSWALGDSVGSDEFDFRAVAIHELLHSFGFSSRIGKPGNNDNVAWTVFASFVVTSDDTKVIGANGKWNSAYNPNLTGGNGGLYFGGASAVAAYGGLVPLFTPNPWEQGSSLGHLDDKTFIGTNEKMMNAKTDKGPSVRVLSPMELGILKDLGYTVTPKTPTYAAFMFVGVIFVRRPKRSSTSPNPAKQA
jgi:hypothetical protein